MSNYLAEVLQAKESATIDELNEILRIVESKISQLKIGVIQSLNSSFVLYETDVDRVLQWFTEILEIQNQLEDLEGQLGKDKQVLHSAYDDLESIQLELGQSQASITLLKGLVQVVQNFERADPKDYVLASELIRDAEIELSSIGHSFPSAEDHIWIKHLRARFSDLVVDVYGNCIKEWRRLFRFETKSLTIYPHGPNIGDLVTSLKNIKMFNGVWEKFVTKLWQELFKWACSKDYKIEVYSSRTNIECKVEGQRKEDCKDSLLDTDEFQSNSMEGIVVRAVKLAKPYKNADGLFENLIALIKELHTLFSDDSEEMANLSNVLAAKINDELSHKYLKTLILQDCGGDVERAKADVACMKNFVEHLANKMNFHFPPDNIFESIESNFDKLFICQIREALIVKIRDLIMSDLHNTEEINHETMPNSALSPDEIVLLRKNPALFPKCVVSKSIADVVRLLKDHTSKYTQDYMICANALSLYLALMRIPKHEADTSDFVPLTTVLIHNNSLFLAHHAGFTFKLCDDAIPELRAKASQAIASMMRCVRVNLNEMISTAMSSIEERVERNIDITHDFLVITAELKRLNNIMNGVLAPLGWHDILATLVDHTVNEMCSKVLAWDDIPANTASELATAFTQFAVATSSLFKGDAESPREIEALTTRAVKKWQRFRLLIFVLTASMKEIETKWVGGCGPLAIEFTPEEVRRLVRALFQNTDRRAKFLATIK